MIRMIISTILMMFGMFMFLTATIGVNKYKYLNRIHTAALGDTLGLFFVILSLVIWRGMDLASVKLLCVMVFFWMASPVAGHMLSRLVVETDDDLGEIEVIDKDEEQQI